MSRLLVLVPLAGGCLLGPYDGQVVSSSTTPIGPWGVYSNAGAAIQVDYRDPVSNGFVQYATATSRTTYYTLFGSKWYEWYAPTAAIPAAAWRSGVTGKRAEVRARSGSTLLTSYPYSGLSCLLDADYAGESASQAQGECQSASSPSAYVFTADYRGLPTFTPQSPEDYPKELDNDRTEEIQGAASDGTFWWFTRNNDPEVFRIAVTTDLAAGSNWDAAIHSAIPSTLTSLGYNHYGDPDEYAGKVYVPVEGGASGAIAQYDANLNFLGYATLSGPKAPWVAIDPKSGRLYTSAFCDVDGVDVYTMSFSSTGVLTGLTLYQHRPLWLADSVPTTVQAIQGGAFSDNGNLYLVSDAKSGVCTGGTSGVYGFEGPTLRQEAYFPVTYDTGNGEELEGLEVRTISGAPGIGGQIHLVMLDNDTLSNDDLYFKHYLAASAELGFL